MSDIFVKPVAGGWTVLHERILFERFESRAAAVRRAVNLAGQLRKIGDRPALRLLDRSSPSRRSARS